MQKAWLEARYWDELLPSDHQREWTEWFRELEDLELVKIVRYLKDPSPKVEEQSIHTFSYSTRRPWNKRPDSKRISTLRVMVEWARISKEVKTRLARVQV